jgi:hypothetical protein
MIRRVGVNNLLGLALVIVAAVVAGALAMIVHAKDEANTSSGSRPVAAVRPDGAGARAGISFGGAVGLVSRIRLPENRIGLQGPQHHDLLPTCQHNNGQASQPPRNLLLLIWRPT